MTKLIVGSVSSSSLLRRSLSPGEADKYGEFDGETLVVGADTDAEELVNRYPNVRFPENEPAQNESETVRMEADNDGVEYKCGINGCSRDVDEPSERCWQHQASD